MKRAPRGTGSIYKDSSGYWNAQVYLGVGTDGKTKYKKFRGKTQADVLSKKRNFELQMANGVSASINTNTNITFSEYAKNYLYNKKINDVKRSTFDRIIRTFENQVNPNIGAHKMSAISSDFIQTQLINSMIDDGLSYSSIHKVYILINEIFRSGVKNGIIKNNPCEDVIEPKKENLYGKEIRFFDDSEIERFISQANKKYKNGKDMYKYGNILTLIIFTGLRGGELCALKWKDVDFTGRKISIYSHTNVIYEYGKNNTKTRKIVEQSGTKTNKGRVLPLNDSAIKILKDQYNKIGGDKNAYVINGEKTIVPVDVISQSFTTIAKAAGINDPQGVHTLRHTFASLMIRRGVDIKVVSQYMGHSSTAFTYDTYVHLVDAQLAVAIEQINI